MIFSSITSSGSKKASQQLQFGIASLKVGLLIPYFCPTPQPYTPCLSKMQLRYQPLKTTICQAR